MKFLAGFLQGKCQQCLDPDYKSIYFICSCGAELCEKHAFFHNFENHTKYPIQMALENGVLCVQISDNDCSLIEGALEVLKYKGLAASLINKQQKHAPCMHIFKVFKEMTRVFDNISKISLNYNFSECCICSLRENRWLCITCGLVYCGGQRYNVMGNGHAHMHFERTEHSIFINLNCFNPQNHEMQAFCSYCSIFMQNEIVYKIFNSRYTALSMCNECTEVDLIKRKEECTECTKGKLISNNPESSNLPSGYVLSVIQSISYCILNMGIIPIFDDLIITEKNTEFKNAVNEIIAKVINMLVLEKTEYIFTDHIEDLVNSGFEPYNEDSHVDAARFFRNFMSMLKKNEMPEDDEKNLTTHFYILLRSIIICNNCKEKWDRSEKLCILYLKPNQSISEFFSIKQLDKACRCGAPIKTVTSYLANIPNIMTIRLKKPTNSILGENTECKIQRTLSIPHRECEKKKETISAKRPSESLNEQGVPAPYENSHLITSRLIPQDIYCKLPSFFVKNHLGSKSISKEAFKPETKNSFLNYRLKAAVIYQNNTYGGYYFTQILDDRVFLNNLDENVERINWITFIDGQILKLPLFKEDVVLLLYVHADE
ncbi:hypothetical protein NEPAR04_1956 [Nematocida parisii]|nr:hypothetical protein NEPAR03_2014 [Nematocida parisii]KAI5143820.1 hypothetical protein NEPAR04_1956 [Nematocida parisii]